MIIPPPPRESAEKAALPFLAAAVAVCFLMLSSDNPTAPLAQAHEVDDGIPSAQMVGGDSVPAHEWKGDAASAQAYALAWTSASALNATVTVSPSVDVDEVVFEPGFLAVGNELKWEGEVGLIAHEESLPNEIVFIVVQRSEHRVHGWIPIATGTVGGILGIPGGGAGVAAGVGIGAFVGEGVRWILGFDVEIRNKIYREKKAKLRDWDLITVDKLASADGAFAGVDIHVTDEYHWHPPSSSSHPSSVERGLSPQPKEI